MVRAELNRPRMMEAARRLGLPLQRVDEGYLLHCVLRALFGAQAPQPFIIHGLSGRRLTVLGYSGSDDRQLGDYARTFADPVIWAACEVDAIASKPMPDRWRRGLRLGFETRVSPLARASAHSGHVRQGAEVDFFLKRCWEVGELVPVDREKTYCEWLSRELGREGAATLTAARLLSLRRERFARRDHSNSHRLVVCERPDATMTGTLEVGDPAAFARLLRRGLGRHRAFGLGMLLLRPVGDS